MVDAQTASGIEIIHNLVVVTKCDMIIAYLFFGMPIDDLQPLEVPVPIEFLWASSLQYDPPNQIQCTCQVGNR